MSLDRVLNMLTKPVHCQPYTPAQNPSSVSVPPFNFAGLQEWRVYGLASWQWRGYRSGVATAWLLGSGVATVVAWIRLGYLVVAWLQQWRGLDGELDGEREVMDLKLDGEGEDMDTDARIQRK